MGLLEYRSLGISGEDDRICIDLIEGLPWLSSVRGTDWIVPRLDGRQPGNRRKDMLTFPLAGYVRGYGTSAAARREDFLEAVTALMAVMQPSLGLGSLVASMGYLGLSSGQEAVLEARVKNGAPGKMEAGQSFQLWTFEMEAVTPEMEIGS